MIAIIAIRGSQNKNNLLIKTQFKTENHKKKGVSFKYKNMKMNKMHLMSKEVRGEAAFNRKEGSHLKGKNYKAGPTRFKII
jgi:hypothetical protein